MFVDTIATFEGSADGPFIDSNRMRVTHGTRMQLGLNLVLGSNDRQKHVECNLDSVDEDKSVLCGDELEVHGMNNRPDLPRSLACSKQIILDLVPNGSERIPVDQSEVSEENGHEERTPDNLVKNNLHGHGLSVLALDEVIQPVVKVVA